LIGGLYVGDNLVWETDAGAYVDLFVEKFVRHSLTMGYDLIYVSFNRSPMTMVKRLSELPNQENITLLDCFTSGKGDNDNAFTRFYESGDQPGRINVIRVDNPADPSGFTETLNEVEEEKGEGARYIFDSMTGMQALWGDEVKTYKFFTYSCPRLYDLNTVAYWILEREAHTPSFKANLEHVTQVALEVSHTGGQLFLKLTKAENRYSPNMFKPRKFEVWDGQIVFREAAERELLDLGGKVKSLRLRRGLTQTELGKKIGVTASYISQLERNLVSPSMDSLILLIDELQIDPGRFFSLDKSYPHRIICRKSQRQPISLASLKEDMVKCQSLANQTGNRRMQPMLITIEPNSEFSHHFFNHKGDEFILILKGELELDIDNERYLLQEGDSIYLDSVIPGAWHNPGEVPAQAVWVLSPQAV
jgi:transcriptional regulator with XRE-family HTH domain